MQNSGSLRGQVAGQSAMSEVLDAQGGVQPRHPVARLFGANPLVAKARLPYREAVGELLVGDTLDSLGQRWDALHDIPLGSSILDHLVIGPAGVFTVHTVSYGAQEVAVNGTVLAVAGEPTEDIRAASVDADIVGRVLADAVGRPVAVQPLLVIVEPRRLVTRVPATRVTVLASWQLQQFIRSAPHTLDGDEVARLSDLADRAETWPGLEPGQMDTQELTRGFATVRHSVRRAFHRRVAWATCAIVVSYLALWTAIATGVATLFRP